MMQQQVKPSDEMLLVQNSLLSVVDEYCHLYRQVFE